MGEKSAGRNFTIQISTTYIYSARSTIKYSTCESVKRRAPVDRQSATEGSRKEGRLGWTVRGGGDGGGSPEIKSNVIGHTTTQTIHISTVHKCGVLDIPLFPTSCTPPVLYLNVYCVKWSKIGLCICWWCAEEGEVVLHDAAAASSSPRSESTKNCGPKFCRNRKPLFLFTKFKCLTLFNNKNETLELIFLIFYFFFNFVFLFFSVFEVFSVSVFFSVFFIFCILHLFFVFFLVLKKQKENCIIWNIRRG